MSQGWIKLHRIMTKWEWYTDHNTCRLFIHCLLRANHTDTKWRGQEIKRGQFITSIETLQKETGLTTSQIRTSIKKLISTSEIASLSQARSRVITVVEYDRYQGDDKLDDRLMTSSSQADDKLMTTDKNDKNVNNEKNVKKIATIPSLTNEINEVFTSWCEVMEKQASTALSPKRKKSIEKRLREGYSVSEIKTAIFNCSNTDHNMGRGENSNGTKYNDIELICRNPENLERFRDNPGKGRTEQDNDEFDKGGLTPAHNQNGSTYDHDSF